jgi:hypothetical protein
MRGYLYERDGEGHHFVRRLIKTANKFVDTDVVLYGVKISLDVTGNSAAAQKYYLQDH